MTIISLKTTNICNYIQIKSHAHTHACMHTEYRLIGVKDGVGSCRHEGEVSISKCKIT